MFLFKSTNAARRYHFRTMPTAAESLAEFVAGLRFEQLPDEVVSTAKRHLLDALGVALAAAGNGVGAPAVEMVRSWAGAREASVIGQDFGAPAPAAALANGVLAHALDFDDTHTESVTHPSAFVLAAALGVSEEASASGRDMLTAAVAAYEVGTRIASTAPGRFHVRGFHPTGIVAPFGAAAAAGRLWGLDPEQMTSAFGVAGSQSSGVFAYVSDGSETKRLHAGWGAAAGIVAADLARRGFTGPRTIFEGPNGIFDAFLAGEKANLPRLTRGLGSEWETTRIAIKPYPACHFLHAFMDAASRSGIRWGDVEEITCAIAPAAIGVVCEPRAPRLQPATTYAAQFSLPFAVASALVGGRAGLELFGEEARADRRILTLAERVRYEPDESLPFPRTYGGRMVITTRAGRTIELEELVNRGHPERPLSEAELVEKFLANATRRLDSGTAEKLVETAMRLDELDSVAELAGLAQLA
jgi:2-methylcitrate dehydratase PrpD